MNDEDGIKNIRLPEVISKAKELYTKKSELYCPYFGQKILLTADGFGHLQYKVNREPRNISEQILKLSLLKKAIEIIPKIGTLQEYRNQLEKTGERQKSGFYKTKQIQYWGFHAILDGNKRKIKIILKQRGDGNIIFWSVMPFNQKLYSQDIAEL